MQGPAPAGGPGLERGLVAGHGAEVLPHPADHLLGLLDAAEVGRADGLVGPELGFRQAGELVVPAWTGRGGGLVGRVCLPWVVDKHWEGKGGGGGETENKGQVKEAG